MCFGGGKVDIRYFVVNALNGLKIIKGTRPDKGKNSEYYEEWCYRMANPRLYDISYMLRHFVGGFDAGDTQLLHPGIQGSRLDGQNFSSTIASPDAPACFFQDREYMHPLHVFQ
jgi:hypothetical protein